jgi:hypothetical protein
LYSSYLNQLNYTEEQKLLFNSIVDKLKDLKEIECHREIANRQKKTYNNMIKNLNTFENSIIIEVFRNFFKIILNIYKNFIKKLDYKQKIVFGLAPRATNEQFYNQKQASCLGFGIYYKDEEKIKCLNIDILSDCLEQDANAVIRSYEFIRKLDIFKRFERIRNYIIWSDCGSQFRCKELNYYYFTTLAEEGISVNSNYFGEKHGKFSRDQHFSLISYYIRRESIKFWIKSAEDIAEIINSSQINSNIFRMEQSKNEIQTRAYVLNPNFNQKYIKKIRVIQHLTCFYNLQNVFIEGEFYLNSTVYSDLEKFIDPKYLDSVVSSENSIINFKDKNIAQESELNIESYLKIKRQRIEIFLSTATPQPSPSKVIDTSIRNIQISQPTFLSPISNPTTSKKPEYCTNDCNKCKAHIEYSLEQLNAKNGSKNLIGQIQINDELFKHSHPKSRKINSNFRNTEQARNELINHYKYAHNLLE